MKINTNSWHYKLNRYTWGNDIPKHFCPYARLLLFNILVGGWMQFLYSHINLNIELPHWGLTRFITRMIRHNKWFFNIEVIYGLWGMLGVYHLLQGDTIMGITSLGITGGMYLFIKKGAGSVKFFEERSSRFKGISEKSIVLQSVKNNHEKICPSLEFVDNTIVKFNEDVSQIKEPELEPEQTMKEEKPDSLIDDEEKINSN